LAAPSAEAAILGPATQFPVADGPTRLATGDFNRDGITDVVTSSPGVDTVSVLLGLPAGGFAPAAPLTGAGFGLAVDDFNGDGDQDLAIGTDAPSIRLGAPAGTFGSASAAGPTIGVNMLRVADFNQDGDPDIAVATGNQIAILLGAAGGTFAAPVPISFGVNHLDLAVGDFDGDLDLDFATADNPVSEVRVALGAGDGTFTPQVAAEPAGPNPRRLIAADLNGDGDLDLAVLGLDTAVYVANGDPASAAFADGLRVPLPALPLSVAAGDLNRDGVADLVVGAENAVTVLTRAPNGAFGIAGTFPVAGTPTAMAVGAFDGDSWPDVAVAVAATTSHVAVLHNTAAPAARTSAASLAFGSQARGTLSASRTVTVTSIGDVALRPRVVRTAGAARDDFVVTGDSCSGEVIPVGGTCTFAVRFAPSAVGARAASLQVLSDGPPRNVALSGTGAAPSGPAATARTVLAAAFASDRARVRAGNRLRVRFVSTLAGVATLELRRGKRVVRRISDTVTAGRNVLTLRAPRKRGRYTLTLTVTGGGQTDTDVMKLVARRR
jgi:hypothetical protein